MMTNNPAVLQCGPSLDTLGRACVDTKALGALRTLGVLGALVAPAQDKAPLHAGAATFALKAMRP